MLRVNRYYKHFSSPESPSAKEDKLIKTYILTLQGKYKILVKFQINLLNLSPAISRIYSIANSIRTNQTEFGLKAEETNRKNYFNLADLQISLFEYIDGFYNAKCPHSAINFLSPVI